MSAFIGGWCPSFRTRQGRAGAAHCENTNNNNNNNNKNNNNNNNKQQTTTNNNNNKKQQQQKAHLRVSHVSVRPASTASTAAMGVIPCTLAAAKYASVINAATANTKNLRRATSAH